MMADPIQSVPRLRTGELDFALSHEPLDESEDMRAGIELIHLFDDPMYVVMPVGHRLADAPKLELGSFASEPWMLATTNTCPDSRLFLRACHAAGFEPQIAFQNDDYPAIIGFVAAGVGVALIPDMVSRNIRDDVVVRRLDPAPPPRPIFAALPADYCSPAAAAMLDILRGVSASWVSGRRELVVA
jgi:DNA-binding transcriptional LysR family regulator